MAKKSRSRRSQGARLHTATSTRPAANPAQPPARPAAGQAVAPAQRTASSSRTVAPRGREAMSPAVAPVDFASEYHYVLADLKRLGILAAAMFVTLIVLALVF